MKEATARVMWTDGAEIPQTEEWAGSKQTIPTRSLPKSWSPGQFAQEQVRHLVRRIFLAPGSQVRQVSFSPIDVPGGAATVCAMVGDELAGSTNSEVAVVGGERTGGRLGNGEQGIGVEQIKQADDETHPRSNLWFMPANAGEQWHLGAAMRSYVQDIRREFEYSIVQSPSLAMSEEAWALADWADGVVLVISARQTRRASAIKIREMLREAHVRVLGAVLSEREFPIPERIYRRL